MKNSFGLPKRGKKCSVRAHFAVSKLPFRSAKEPLSQSEMASFASAVGFCADKKSPSRSPKKPILAHFDGFSLPPNRP